jgi:hypothetical protein
MDPEVCGQPECCEIPQTPLGFVDSADYYFEYNGKWVKGFAVATSTVSQADATAKAEAAAEENAKLRAGCGTPPVGGRQLFHDRW